jgi:tetratricopeptide (TPR) repeat protein
MNKEKWNHILEFSKAFLAFLAFSLFVILTAPIASAQSTKDLFQQAVALYQVSPSYENAERVIQLAQTMYPLPAIPEEARKHFVMGSALFKDAKTPDDYAQVISEFTNAVSNAPWWKEAYYNLGLAYGEAGKFDDAITELNLYKSFKLSDDEQRSLQDQLYALDAKKEKAKKAKNKEKTPEEEFKHLMEHQSFQKDMEKAKSLYQGKNLKAVFCRGKWVPGQHFPVCGCTLNEMDGNWYYFDELKNLPDSQAKFDFQENDSIVVTFYTGYGHWEKIYGKPVGTQINWYYYNPPWRDYLIWTKGFLDGKFYFSYKEGVECEKRPINDSDFNSYDRYYYILIYY